MDTSSKSGMWQERATACKMLAFSFRYPSAELARAVYTGEWAEAAFEIAASLGASLPERFAESLSCGAAGDSLSEDELFHALRTEATRLFVGVPHPIASPYEGIWRAEDDGVEGLTFVNPHSMAVERFMASCGLKRPAGTNEPLDHVAAEWELLQVLALWAAEPKMLHEGAPAFEELPGGSPQAAYAQFVEEHLSAWVPRFAAKVQAEAREPYFRDAAILTNALLPYVG